MWCKKVKFAGTDEFKLIQEVYRGLGIISITRQKHLLVKYGQILKRDSNLSKELKFRGSRHPNKFLARQQLQKMRGKTFMKLKSMTQKNVKESRFLDIPTNAGFDLWKVFYLIPRVQICYAKRFQKSKKAKKGSKFIKGTLKVEKLAKSRQKGC